MALSCSEFEVCKTATFSVALGVFNFFFMEINNTTNSSILFYSDLRI